MACYRPVWLLPLLLAACPESARRDARIDAGAADRRLDREADRQVDGARPDRPQFLYDVSKLADQEHGDASLSPATVLYTAAVDPGAFALRTVSTSTPGKPALVSGWNGLLDLEPVALAGLQEQLPVSPQRAQVSSEHPPDYQGIRLPGGLGHLYHVRRKLQGTSGLLRIGSDGGLDLIREVPGLYPDAIGSHLALDGGGLGAALSGATGVFLFRSDGKPWPGSSVAWKDVSPAAGTIAEVRAPSLSLGGGWLHAVATDLSGKQQLLRAPADGSALLTPLSLPAGAGPASSFADELVLSRDGRWLAVAAGADPSQRDLYLIEVGGTTVRNLTKAPDRIEERGATFGGQSARLALSPAGSLAAFVRGGELFVVRGDGSSAPVQVTSDARFLPEVTQLGNLHLPDEDNLIFMAGQASFLSDVYRWNHASAKADNLTGSTAQPFSGLGDRAAQAGWISPSGKWLYLAVRRPGDWVDLLGVNLQSFAVLEVTSQAQVQTSPGSLVACPSSGQVYFAAKPDPKLYPNEIWSFDQESGKPAVKRTAVSGGGSWSISGLRLSADCSRLIWSAGGTYNLRELWLLPTQGGAVRRLTPAPAFITSSFGFSPDQATIVFGSGASSSAASLKALPLAPGPQLTLDQSAGSVHVFAVY